MSNFEYIYEIIKSIIFLIFLVLVLIFVIVPFMNEQFAIMSITSGIIVDKDFGSNSFKDFYYLVIDDPNDDTDLSRKISVPPSIYSEYKVGDYFDIKDF